MNSVWTENAVKPAFCELDKSIKTDVLIIGGGMAGIFWRADDANDIWLDKKYKM